MRDAIKLPTVSSASTPPRHRYSNVHVIGSASPERSINGTFCSGILLSLSGEICIIPAVQPQSVQLGSPLPLRCKNAISWQAQLFAPSGSSSAFELRLHCSFLTGPSQQQSIVGLLAICAHHGTLLRGNLCSRDPVGLAETLSSAASSSSQSACPVLPFSVAQVLPVPSPLPRCTPNSMLRTKPTQRPSSPEFLALGPFPFLRNQQQLNPSHFLPILPSLSLVTYISLG